MPSNVENILGAILTGDGSGIQKPASRVEELLFEIYEQGGGGGGDSVIGGIKLTIDSDYVMTVTLVDKDGEEYGTSDDIDLPLETMVVDGTYDPLTQKIKLELKNGNYVEFSVAELVNGLQTELSSNNKLNPAYIAYDASHRAVSDDEKGVWNAKQNAISDLEAIRSGASAGATAVQPSTMETALAGKQDSLDNTQMQAVNSGINSTKAAQIETNKDNILYAMNRVGKNILPIDLKTLKARNTHGTWVGNSYTEYGITFTINDDCTVSISGTNASSNDNALLKLVTYLDYLPEIQAGRYTLSGCPSGGSTQSYYLGAHRAKTTGTIASYVETGSEVTGEFDYSLATTNQSNISIAIAANYAITGTIVFSPMLRNASIEDGTYEHYALPNYELTKLESEDRSALAEVVDNGAKNQLNLNGTQSSVYGLTVTWDYANGTVKVNGTVTGTTDPAAYIHLGSWTAPADGYYKLYAENANSSNIYVYNDATWGTSPVSVYDSVRYFSKGTSFDHIYLRVSNGYTVNNVTIKPMICTLEDWKVSQKFAPYRMDYDKLIDFATAKSVPTTDFIEFATGYSNVAQTNIYRQGNHIFGRIICQKTSGNFSSSQQTIATIKSAYRPTENQIGQSYYNSSTQWGIEAIGYSYLSSDGTVIVKTYSDGDDKYNHCMFLVDFLIKT